MDMASWSSLGGWELHLSADYEEFAIGVVKRDVGQVDTAAGLFFASVDPDVER
jgi:hypothetical protein